MPDKIEWHKALNVGHDRIDFEHKIFFALIKNFSIAVSENKPRDFLARTLFEVERYAQFHFLSEENIALDNGESPRELTAHQRIHQYLLNELQMKIQRLQEGKEEGQDIVNFLVDWFGLHSEQDRERVDRFDARLGLRSADDDQAPAS